MIRARAYRFTQFIGTLAIALAVILTVSLIPPVSHAQDADALAKQASDEMRKTQSMIFKGKKEKSFEALGVIDDLIGQIRSADPNNKRLRSLDSQFKRMVKDVERRTGKKYAIKSGSPPAGAQPAAPAKSKTAAPAKAAPKTAAAKAAAPKDMAPGDEHWSLQFPKPASVTKMSPATGMAGGSGKPRLRRVSWHEGKL